VPNTEPVVAEASVPEEAAPPVRKPEPARGSWVPSVQSLLSTIVIAVFVITFAVQAFQIPSESMENTLLIGDYLLVNKLRYGGPFGHGLVPYQPVRRLDIIVFHYPVNPAQHFVKRVIGVPGDHVRMVNRQVWVNGLPLKETYARFVNPVSDIYRDDFPQPNRVGPGEDGHWFERVKQLVKNGELVVPAGEYFVMGDNRDQSYDSRYWGLVPQENIIGSPLLIYWSIRNPDNDFVGLESTSDRLFHFVHTATHLFQLTRWDRTFRLVN
jgi:signal peptidase I